MPVVQIDVCPACGVDISRRFGLIRTKSMACPKCGCKFRVTRTAVVNNWQFHGAMVVSALLGVGWILGALVVTRSSEDRWGTVFGGGVAAWMVGLFVGMLIGRIAGYVKANQLGIK